MSLDALAPDQRAVVQLVLQQERSYDELAGLLGISSDAVRERAHRGLDRLAPISGVDAEDRAEVADYLLGQLSVSRRESARALLGASAAANEWARAIAAELGVVARGPLPEIPDASGRPAVAEPEPDIDDEDDDDLGFVPDEPEPASTSTLLDEPATTEAPSVRARPRPRAPERPRSAPDLALPRAAERKRSSLFGGALLIGGLAVLLTVGVILLVSGDDDNGGETAGNGDSTPSATASPTATPSFQAIGQIPLAGEGKAKGAMTIFQASTGALAFTVQGTDVPANREGEAYAIWMTGTGKPHRLGFVDPAVGEDGKLGASGPRESDAERFPRWLTQARRVVVTRETSQDTTEPGEVVLSGEVPAGGQ